MARARCASRPRRRATSGSTPACPRARDRFRPDDLAASPAAQLRDGAVDSVRRLLVRELVLVARRLLHAQQLRLQGPRQLLMPGLAVQVVELVRIVREVEQLPLVLLP